MSVCMSFVEKQRKCFGQKYITEYYAMRLYIIGLSFLQNLNLTLLFNFKFQKYIFKSKRKYYQLEIQRQNYKYLYKYKEKIVIY